MKLFKKILIAVFIVLIITFGISSFLVFSNSKYKLTAKPSLEVFDSIMDAKVHGKTIELKDDEINSVFSILLKHEVTKGDITVYGIETNIKASKITFYLPVSYKGVKMLISTSGIILDNGNDIIYKPSYIMVGRMKLPLKFLLSKVKDKNIDKFKVKDYTISLSKSFLPFVINDLKIIDDHMQFSFDKPSLVKKENPSEKTEPTDKAEGGKSDNSGSSLFSNTSSSSNKTTTVVNPSPNQKRLKELSFQLSSTINTVIGSKEKEILTLIKKSVDKRIANPNYNIYNDVSSVKSSYKALAPEERGHIKSAILSTVDIQNAMELREVFGI